MKKILDGVNLKITDYDKETQYAVAFSMIPLEAKRIILYLLKVKSFKGKNTEFMKEINIHDKYLAANFNKLGIRYCIDNNIINVNRLCYQLKEITLNNNYKENVIKTIFNKGDSNE